MEDFTFNRILYMLYYLIFPAAARNFDSLSNKCVFPEFSLGKERCNIITKVDSVILAQR